MRRAISWILVGWLIAGLIASGPQAFAAPSAKASEPVPDCVAIGKAGASVVSRCVDDEMDKVCYVTTGGFMFCLEE
jgi:hypothetical protein